MLYKYKALTKNGEERNGTIDAVNEDIAISSLQRRNLVVVSVTKPKDNTFFKRDIRLFEGVSVKDMVMLSQQMSILFDAQIPALRVFQLLSKEYSNDLLKEVLKEVADDVQGGMSISKAFNKHPKVFSKFYVSVVSAGEETGELSETFVYLAEYIDRNYQLTTKVKNALTYPIFVVFVFIAVMILMLTLVIPNLASMILESGQEVPIYTKAVIGFSSFLVDYGLFMFVLLLLTIGSLWYFNKNGAISFARIKLDIPLFGKLFRNLYVSRFADNMHTMLSNGIPIVLAIEITGDVVDNIVYKEIFEEVSKDVKTGVSFSGSLEKHEQFPSIVVQMIRVGEETGELASILKHLSMFYRREVYTTADTLTSLIEPIMIVFLGVGVGVVLISVLAPIYSISGGM